MVSRLTLTIFLLTFSNCNATQSSHRSHTKEAKKATTQDEAKPADPDGKSPPSITKESATNDRARQQPPSALVERSFAAGDANQDGFFDSEDWVLLLKAAKYETDEPATWPEGDFNGDGVFDSGDIVAIYQSGCEYEGDRCAIEESYPPGDSNYDGVFDSADLVILFQDPKYETGEPATWEQGDWNGDGLFDTSDIVLLYQEGCQYEEVCSELETLISQQQ